MKTKDIIERIFKYPSTQTEAFVRFAQKNEFDFREAE
jgi:hypothetical protein